MVVAPSATSGWPRSRIGRMPCCCATLRMSSCDASSDDEFAHLVGDGEDFVDADALVVAGTAAQVAAGTAPELGCELFAAATFEERHLLDRGRYGSTHCGQLRRTRRWPTTPEQRRREQERLDAHVEEAVQRGAGVGRVERRQHEVAGERGLHGDRAVSTSRISPTRIDVGILAEDRRGGRRRTSRRPVR